MNTTSTITKSIAAVVTLATASIGLGIASPEAHAYNIVQSNPTIGCLAGQLDVHGRAITGSYNGERVYSMFFIYVWTGHRWQLQEQTNWVALDVGLSKMAANEYSKYKQSGAYYYAWERIASWDGSKWRYNDQYSSLKSNYAAYGTYYGSGYYARCS